MEHAYKGHTLFTIKPHEKRTISNIEAEGFVVAAVID